MKCGLLSQGQACDKAHTRHLREVEANFLGSFPVPRLQHHNLSL